MVRSAPVKSAVIATRSVESPISMLSGLAAFCCCAEATPPETAAAISSAAICDSRRILHELQAGHRVAAGRRREEVEGKPQRHRKNQHRQQRPQLLAAQLLAGPRAVLGAGHAAKH